MSIALAASGAVAGPMDAYAAAHGRHEGCFEEVRGRAQYKTVTVTVPQAPLITYRRTPAVYRKETRTVVVRAAHVVTETIPAVYRTVAQKRTLEGPVRRISVPARYKIVEERQEIEPAHLEWRRSAPRRGFADDGQPGMSVTPTGEVLCRVLVPARTAIVRRQVMVAPPEEREVRGPARRIICYVKVLAEPARKTQHTVPAVTKTVVVDKLVKAAGCEKVVTPRPPKTVQRQVRVGRAPSSWRRLNCQVAHGEAPMAPRAPAPEAAPPSAPPASPPAADPR